MFNPKQLLVSIVLATITVMLIIVISLTQHFSELSPIIDALWLATKTYPVLPLVVLIGAILYFCAGYYVLMRIINFVVRFL